MQVYEIKKSECSNADRVFTKLQQQRQQLEETKALIEPYFRSDKADEFRKYLSLRDPFKFARFTISDRYNTPSVSTAWIKIIEILYHFKLDDIFSKKLDITIYDHAALPGSGLLALIHYISTVHSDKHWKWYANSASENIEADDTYGLFHNYGATENWLGSFKNTAEDIKRFCDTCDTDGFAFDVFISDTGIDCHDQFDKQEELHWNNNIAQFAAAMGTIADNGMMICKMFTYGTKDNVWLLENVAECFEKLYVCKPLSSKSNNAEIYVVGTKFDVDKGSALYHRLIQKMTRNTEVQIPNNYLKSLYQIFLKLSEIQSTAVKHEIQLYEKHKSDQQTLRHVVGEQNKKITDLWYSKIALKTLSQLKWLHIINTTPYQPKAKPVVKRW